MTLFIFDLDGTLISGYMDSPGRNYDSWQPLPRRAAYLRHIISRGHTIAVATNQGAVAFGYVSERDARAKIAAALAALGQPDAPVYVCFADARSTDARYSDPAQAARRKPSPAMLQEAMANAGASAADTIYVGDRPEDEQAAAAAGVRYVDAEEFFSRPVGWDIVDGAAIRPSDARRFSVETTRTTAGYELYRQLGGDVQAIAETARRVQVRVTRAWGDLDDESPAGVIEVSIDGGPWIEEGGDLAYILSGTR